MSILHNLQIRSKIGDSLSSFEASVGWIRSQRHRQKNGVPQRSFETSRQLSSQHAMKTTTWLPTLQKLISASSIIVHLNNREANRTLNIIWSGTQLPNSQKSKYISLKVLSYFIGSRLPSRETKAKVSTPNNCIQTPFFSDTQLPLNMPVQHNSKHGGDHHMPRSLTLLWM